MNWIKSFIQIFFITAIVFFTIDFSITAFSGYRGFSKFFTSDSVEGRMNKPYFSGLFGSPLTEFKGLVNIGKYGERLSSTDGCENVLSKILFLGDSITAGFEVDDNKTFVSLFNKNCKSNGKVGINLGVRGHDTHAVIGTYIRVKDYLPHKSVVYFITKSDLEANINPEAYNTLTKKFGRRFNNTIIKPEESIWFKIYAGIRIFISDNLSLTTFTITRIIKLKDIILKSNINEIYNQSDIANRIDITFQLISKLNDLANANGSKLYVIPQPNLFSKKDDNNLFDKLGNKIQFGLPEVIYITDIDKKVKKLLLREKKKIVDMRFKSDMHLSEYGHKIIAEVLETIID